MSLGSQSGPIRIEAHVSSPALLFCPNMVIAISRMTITTITIMSNSGLQDCTPAIGDVRVTLSNIEYKGFVYNKQVRRI